MGLTRFRAGASLGVSMAAMKLLIALILHAQNAPAEDAGDEQGTAALSYDSLTELTDLSRGMVAHGVRFLERHKLVAVERGKRGAPSKYRLAGYGLNDPWGRIPNRRLFRHAEPNRIMVLHELSCRRECDLNALKLYLLFSAFRDNRSRSAMIGYDKIEDYTGIASGKIRQAVSVLVEQGLVAVDREKDPENKQNHPNKYEILGL